MIKNKTVVYTSGTFDLFHINHLRIIQYARSLGDYLIVGVNTDEFVKKFKKHKPIIPYIERLEIIRALKYPDLVIPQTSLDHRNIIKKMKIDIFVVGDDWYNKFDYLSELNIDVIYTPYGKDISTTLLKNKIYQKKLFNK